MDGFQLIGRIREMSDLHVLVLTGLGSDEHIVRGLDLGADEYLVKPVTKRVFLARVHSMLRRVPPPQDFPTAYSDSFLTLDALTHDVQVRGQSLHLAPTEFKLLAVLVQNSDRVVTHHELLESVWGGRGGSLESLKWHIASVRDKIGAGPEDRLLIVSVPRVGYRYLPPESRLAVGPVGALR